MKKILFVAFFGLMISFAIGLMSAYALRNHFDFYLSMMFAALSFWIGVQFTVVVSQIKE